MKNILLLTDFSENALNAMHYSIKLMWEENCNFYIHHVYASSSYISDDLVSSGTKSVYDSVLRSEKKQLQDLKRNLEHNINKTRHKLKTSIDYDSFIDSINQMIVSESIDLVVMGNNGVTGAKEIIFGSNTVNVIKNIESTTLIVPEQTEYNKLSQVLIPLEIDNHPFGTWFKNALNFVKNFKAKLHILRIDPENDDIGIKESDIKNLNKLLRPEEYKYGLTVDVPIHYSISSYLQVHAIDLTILQIKKAHFFDRFLGNNSTNKIGNDLKTPLLVYHDS